MAYAVLLDIEADADAALGALAARLAENEGLETLPQLGVRHHVSLAVYDDLALEDFKPALARFIEAASTLTISLSAVATFPGTEGVLFLVPAPSDELIALHRSYHQQLAAFGGACSPLYRPGAWVPHVTLAINAVPAALHAAIDVVLRDWHPGSVRLDAVSLISTAPVAELLRRPLLGRVKPT